METRDIITKLQELKPNLQQEYAVKTLGLFGSYANGTQTDNSDIDILVEFDEPIGWRFFTLEKYLEKALNRKIDLVTVNALRDQMRPVILSQVQYI